eukprot:335102-Chlamydomonas_euryale.AAC.4
MTRQTPGKQGLDEQACLLLQTPTGHICPSWGFSCARAASPFAGEHARGQMTKQRDETPCSITPAAACLAAGLHAAVPQPSTSAPASYTCVPQPSLAEAPAPCATCLASPADHGKSC